MVGAVALAAAIEALTAVGLDRLAAHEMSSRGTRRARLAAIPGVTIHGPAAADKVGVIPFSVAGVDHALVAAVLADEHGIGVRSGCFCAHPYVAHLLGLDADRRGGLGEAGRRGRTAWLARRGPAEPRAATRTATTSTGRSPRSTPSPLVRSAAPTTSSRTVRSSRGGRPPLPARFAG